MILMLVWESICINRSVIANLQPGKAYGFDNLMLDSLKTDTKINIAPFCGHWLDIGRPDDYQYMLMRISIY